MEAPAPDWAPRLGEQALLGRDGPARHGFSTGRAFLPAVGAGEGQALGAGHRARGHRASGEGHSWPPFHARRPRMCWAGDQWGGRGTIGRLFGCGRLARPLGPGSRALVGWPAGARVARAASDMVATAARRSDQSPGDGDRGASSSPRGAPLDALALGRRGWRE